jgi:DNA-directed RNA polymerase specialized sigma24 family protein
VSLNVADKSLLEDADLKSTQGLIDAKHRLNGLLTAAEITEVGRAALLARAMEIPITEIAAKLGTTPEKVKSILYVNRRKLRRIA